MSEEEKGMRVPPHSLEAEAAALGSMMIEKEAVEEAMASLTADDFYDTSHKTVFRTIVEMGRSDRAVDMISVGTVLRERNELAGIGGGEALAMMIDTCITAAHVEEYIRIVRRCSVLRSLSDKCTDIVRRCYDGQGDHGQLLEDAERAIFSISERTVGAELEHVSKSVVGAVDDIEAMFTKKKGTTGMSTGFKNFDELTSGLQPGNMIVVAARPGMGKTALALDFVRRAVIELNVPSALFTLEMTKKEIVHRIISSESGVPLKAVRTGWFGHDKWGDINAAAEKLHEAPLYLESGGTTTTPARIRSATRRLATRLAKANTPLGLVVVDYLQLMSSPGASRESRQAEVAEISRSLKMLAVDLNVPVVALSQLNRQTEEVGRGGKPKLSDLRESGAIEQDADVVVFIWRPGFYKAEASDEEKAITKLIIAKHRNGPVGEIDFWFSRETTRFVELTTKEDGPR